MSMKILYKSRLHSPLSFHMDFVGIALLAMTENCKTVTKLTTFATLQTR